MRVIRMAVADIRFMFRRRRGGRAHAMISVMCAMSVVAVVAVVGAMMTIVYVTAVTAVGGARRLRFRRHHSGGSGDGRSWFVHDRMP